MCTRDSSKFVCTTPPSNVVFAYRHIQSLAACPSCCAIRLGAMCDSINQTATAPPRQAASTRQLKAFDHACSWAVRSAEDFEQYHIEESKRGTQVILQVRLQLAASRLCMMDLSVIRIMILSRVSQLHVSYNMRTLAGWHALPNL